MKVYTIIDTFDDGSDEAYVVHYANKEDALRFFAKYLEHYCSGVSGDTSHLFDDMLSNGHCIDYVSSGEVGHIFVRHEEVNVEFKEDALPFN